MVSSDTSINGICVHHSFIRYIFLYYYFCMNPHHALKISLSLIFFGVFVSSYSTINQIFKRLLAFKDKYTNKNETC